MSAVNCRSIGQLPRFYKHSLEKILLTEKFSALKLSLLNYIGIYVSTYIEPNSQCKPKNMAQVGQNVEQLIIFLGIGLLVGSYNLTNLYRYLWYQSHFLFNIRLPWDAHDLASIGLTFHGSVSFIIAE